MCVCYRGVDEIRLVAIDEGSAEIVGLVSNLHKGRRGDFRLEGIGGQQNSVVVEQKFEKPMHPAEVWWVRATSKHIERKDRLG